MNNKPLRPKHLTIDDIRDGCITLYGDDESETKICMIQEEFRQGIDMIQSHKQGVTFYGSARLNEGNPEYEKVRKLAYRIVKELDYAVFSGGGPGIMEAANRGAYEAGGSSVGLTIKLPTEQSTNKYVNEEIPFYFFFTRKVSMSYTTETCIFCPGGFGTFDELFEMITLKQTGKIRNVPLILFGSEFWKPVEELIQKVLIEKYQTVLPEESKLYVITDSEDEVIKIIQESQVKVANDPLD
jgi:hypothetical protein